MGQRVSFRDRNGRPVNFIAKAVKRPGALRQRLGMRPGQRIATSDLDRIIRARTGQSVRAGNRNIRVTTRDQQQASLARTLKRFSGR